MGRDAAPVRGCIGHHDPDGCTRSRVDRPVLSLSDLDRQSPLAVHSPDELIHVRDVRLQLDDEEGISARMESKDVDDAALAPDRERHLRPNRPSGESAEPAGDELVEPGVPGVQQAIQVSRSPTRYHVEPNVEDCSDSPNHIEAERADMPSLDTGHGRLRNARQPGHGDLP